MVLALTRIILFNCYDCERKHSYLLLHILYWLKGYLKQFVENHPLRNQLIRDARIHETIRAKDNQKLIEMKINRYVQPVSLSFYMCYINSGTTGFQL